MNTIKALLLVLVQLIQLLVRLVWWLIRQFFRLMGVEGWALVSTGEEYEAFIAGYLHRQGFRKIRHTGRTGDFGVDFVAEKGLHTYAIQCKYYSSPVDGSAIQQVVAGMPCYGCDAALVITNSTLTPGAWTLAEVNGVEVLSNVSPGSDLSAFSLSRLLTPGRLVSFTAGCVASIVVLSQLVSAEPPPGALACTALVAGCFLLSGLAVVLLEKFWERLMQASSSDLENEEEP